MAKLTLRESGLDDWYVIELAEHDGRTWLERDGNGCYGLRCSSRMSDADVEGTAAEMLAIANAIDARGHVSFKRCAVRWTDAHAEFWSPRNSQRRGIVSHDDARLLAEEIRAKLGGTA